LLLLANLLRLGARSGVGAASTSRRCSMRS
jgi:hypothetical protein